MAGEAQASTVKTVEVTVAAGRSLVDASGALCKQGAKAMVDTRDVKRLRALGFVAAKDEEVKVPRPGPSISASDGPRVTIA